MKLLPDKNLLQQVLRRMKSSPSGINLLYALHLARSIAPRRNRRSFAVPIRKILQRP